MKRIRTIFASGVNVLKQMRWPARILVLIVLISFFSAGAIVVTGQPGFCNSCHIMNSYYDSWHNSEHSHVHCLDCHLQPGFAGYIKGKINGLAQAVDCMVGRVGTKANATVLDSSCLRPECHSTPELTSQSVDYNGINFIHQKHIETDVDGIKISCGTCHSHFEGNEHFSVNSNVCFTCHFLKGNETGERLVQTGCRSCHEVPNKVIERGFVAINHSEFVSYQASCDDSCHKNEIEKQSEVPESVCLNCHDFGKEHETDSVKLHEAHTHSEKVECFACHGKVTHGRTQVQSVSVMMKCQNCHSDTHQVQQTIYSTPHPAQDEKTGRVLSPMFLTHVECTGCHIERMQKQSGVLDSFGTVAKAIPAACDKCHKKGTGQQYVPFWQGKIKGLFEKIGHQVDKLEERARFETNAQLAQKLYDKVNRARAILEAVSSDGSWGVHNFKYTEAMLLRAGGIVNDTE
ncbi:MAG: NapC/NirT family cytochrome c [Planctomycetota bacterium]